jgi:hypothetical protein
VAISIQTGTPGTPGTDGGGSASVTFSIPSTVPDGSLVVAVHCNDFYGLANMAAPVLSGFSPTMNLLGSADGGANLSHIRVWAFDYPAGASGTARTLTCTETGSHDEDKGLSVYALTGAAPAASCLDGSLVATLFPSTSQSTHVLSGVTTSQAGSLLIAHIRTSSGAGGVTYTAPGSMTEQYDVPNFTVFTGATEVLAGAGATGTRTFTPSGSLPWVGVLFAIAPASAGTAPTWIPIQRSRRPAPARTRRSRASQPPLPVAAPSPQAGQERRPRVIPAPKARDRSVAPVRPQVNPPYPTNEDAQPRRLRGLLPRRGRIEMPPWPQQTPPVNPDWLAQPRARGRCRRFSAGSTCGCRRGPSRPRRSHRRGFRPADGPDCCWPPAAESGWPPSPYRRSSCGCRAGPGRGRSSRPPAGTAEPSPRQCRRPSGCRFRTGRDRRRRSGRDGRNGSSSTRRLRRSTRRSSCSNRITAGSSYPLSGASGPSGRRSSGPRRRTARSTGPSPARQSAGRPAPRSGRTPASSSSAPAARREAAVLNPAPALARGRLAAESLMVDTCTIRRRSAPITSTIDASVTYTTTTVYSGKCRFQQQAADARTEDAGEAYLRLLRLEVQLPMSVVGVQALDEVTCDTSVLDPDLPGRVFLVRDLAHKTHATSRRIRVEERT